MRGPDITEQPGRVDEATCAAAESPPFSAAAPFFIFDDAELLRDLPAYRPLQNIACENPDTLRGTFSGGAELSFHSTGVTDQ